MTPWAEGTGGFFIAEGGDSNRVLLVTARHVISPQADNGLLQWKNSSQPRRNVIALSPTTFSSYIQSIEVRIDETVDNIQFQQDRVDGATTELSSTDDPALTTTHAALLTTAQDTLKDLRALEQQLRALHQQLLAEWSNPDDRIIGHVVYSPPISVGSSPEGFCEDWPLSRSIPTRLTLSSSYDQAAFKKLMYANPKNFPSFKYPLDDLLKLEGTIPEKEMTHPSQLDEDGEGCLVVIKRGLATGPVGRASGLFSFTRIYRGAAGSTPPPKTAKEWAVLAYNSKSQPFSRAGDSGSVVVDGRGRVGGLLTGGTSREENLACDISYATPVEFLFNRMKLLQAMHNYANFTEPWIAHPKSPQAHDSPPTSSSVYRPPVPDTTDTYTT
ncbi:hypothetical protein B0H17DRAFT_1239095 [Mycena rosella]|uniref:Serine protease n=1 Tax=Mycena rosella TaxID=1033263 RepID=A0AAD7D2A1_MYCRO|nr:hypothetical protein B0H17DRAFT_1239095 [Mycena rosella]